MSVAFSRPADPRAIPEHVLGTLEKDGRRAEGRTRMVPLGPELRVYVTRRETGAFELLWSQVFTPTQGGGGALGARADLTKEEFTARGWTRSRRGAVR